MLVGSADATDCVRPKDSAASGAEFRAAPVGDSQSLGTLARGQTAPFIASVPRWYETRTQAGEVAFVSKQLTQIV